MARLSFRIVVSVGSLGKALAWVPPRGGAVGRAIHGAGGDAEHEERRMADVHRRPARQQVLAARSDQRDATSASSKSRGASRPTTSARVRRTSSKARRSWSRAWSTPPPARRRAVVALDARTGELKWIYSMDEGERARAGRRASSRAAALSYWTDGKGDERIIYVTIGYRLVALNAKTGQPVAVVRQERRRRPEGRRRSSARTSRSISRSGEIGLHSTPTVVNDTIIVGSSMFEGLGYRYSTNAKGLVRAFDVEDRQADLALQHDSRSRRVRQRHLGKRIVGVDRQQRRVDADHRRSRSRPRLPAGRNADHRRIRRQPPRQQPVRREPGRRRPEDRRAQVALPARAPSAVGPRHLVGAAADRRRSSTASRASWSRSRPSRAGCTCSIASPGSRSGRCRKRRCRRRDVPGEKTSPTQPIPTKPPPYARTHRHRRRPDRLHAGAAGNQALENLKKFRWEPTPFIRRRRPERHTPRRDQHRQHRRRHQLARRVVRS